MTLLYMCVFNVVVEYFLPVKLHLSRQSDSLFSKFRAMIKWQEIISNVIIMMKKASQQNCRSPNLINRLKKEHQVSRIYLVYYLKSLS